MTQLEQRVVLLARPESTYGVDSIGPNLASIPSPLNTDSLLCSNLDLKANATILERNNYNPSLSKDNTGVSSTILQLTFTHELRASGVLGTAPRIGRLLRACGFAETTIAAGAAAGISNAVQGPNNTSNSMTTVATTLTKTTAATSRFDTYRITCTVGGAPATAKIMVTGMGFPELDPLVFPSTSSFATTNSVLGTITQTGTVLAPIFTFAGTWVAGEFVEVFAFGLRFFYQVQTGDTVTLIAAAVKTLMLVDPRLVGTNNTAGVLTLATSVGAANAPGGGDFLTSASTQAVTLGSSGAVITLPASYGGTGLVVGEYFEVTLLRPGVRYDPVSDNVTSLTFYVYMDGALYKMVGSRGTFSLEGQGGQYATASFTFTGLYQDPIDAALPTVLAYETSKPFKVELSALQVWGSPNAIASKFAFDIANQVVPKENINASEAFDEIRITDRTPTASCDPEADKPSIKNPWWRLRREDTSRMHVAVGIRGGVGNIVRMQCEEVNYVDVPFANRNKIRVWAFNFRCARVSSLGNDEVFFHFG